MDSEFRAGHVSEKKETRTLLCSIQWLITGINFIGFLPQHCQWSQDMSSSSGHLQTSVTVKRRYVPHVVTAVILVAALCYLDYAAIQSANQIAYIFSSAVHNTDGNTSWCAQIMGIVVALPIFSATFGVVCVMCGHKAYKEVLVSMADYRVLVKDSKAIERKAS